MNIIDIVQKVVASYIDGKLIGYDELLADNGIDSASIIEIVIELEEIFNIEFSPERLNYQTLKSINTISDYLKVKIKYDNNNLL